MDVLLVLSILGGGLVVALVLVAVIVDWENCYPTHPTKEEWRHH